MNINNISDFRTALEQGKWAWPGGYPCYFICADGSPLSFEAANKNQSTITSAIKDRDDDQWGVIGCEVNWEDSALFCSHTNKRIESAYAEDDVVTNPKV